MPLYEFRCRACEAVTEQLLPMGAPRPSACPSCGGELRRLWGRVGVRFEGWGFASTDALLPEGRPRKDFGAVRRRAEEITES